MNEFEQENEAVPEENPVQEIVTAPLESTPASDGPSSDPAPQKKRNIPLIAGVVLLIITIVGGTLFFISQRRDQEANAVARGQQAIVDGNWDTAIQQFDAALATSPAFVRQRIVEATGARGIAHFQNGSAANARADLDMAIAAGAEWADLYAYRALLNFDESMWDEALADGAIALEAGTIQPHIAAQLHANNADIHYAAESYDDFLASMEASLAAETYLDDDTLSRFYAWRSHLRHQAGETELALADSRQARALGAALDPQLSSELYAYASLAYYAAGDATAGKDASDSAFEFADLDPVLQHQLRLARAKANFEAGDLDTALAEARMALDLEDSDPLPHELKALHSFEALDYDAAADAAELALALNPDSGIALRMRGIVHFIHGRIDEARADLDAAVAQNGEDVDAVAWRGYVAGYSYDTATLEEDVAHLKAIAPDHPRTLWTEAWLLIDQDELEAANLLLTRAIELDDGEADYLFARARTYRYTSSRDAVEADLRAGALLNPDHLSALVLELTLSNWHWRYAPTLIRDTAELVIDAYPDHSAGYALLADYYLSQEDYAASQEQVDRALAHNANDLFAHTVKAQLFIEQAMFEEARMTIDAGLAIDPENGLVRLQLANWYVQQEMSAESKLLLAEIIDDQPRNMRARVLMALAELIDEEEATAWAMLNQLLVEDPAHPQALTLRAELLSGRGDVDAAVDDLENAIARTPDYGLPYLIRADLYLSSADLDDADEYASLALERDPRLAFAYLLQAIVAFEQEDAERADGLMESYFAGEAAPLASNYGLHALILWTLERHEEALEAFDAGLLLEPDNEQLLLDKANLLLDMGDEEAAEPILQQLVDTSIDLEVLDVAEVWLAGEIEITLVEIPASYFASSATGIAFSYPGSWVQQAAAPSNGIYFIATRDFTVDDGGVVIVVALEGASGATLQRVAEIGASSFSSLDGFAQVSMFDSTVGGRPALVREYTFLDQFDGVTVPMRGRHYYVINGNYAFIIIVHFTDASWSQAMGEVQFLLNTVQFQ